MKRYQEWAPTGFDHKGLNGDRLDRNEWFVGPCMLDRDSSLLAQSNWCALIAILATEGQTDGGDYEVHRFGHWACGWFEIVLIRPGTAACAAAERVQDALCDYAVLDDSDFSEREERARIETWDNANLRDRADYAVGTRLPTIALRHPWGVICDVYPSAADRIGERMLS